MMRRFVTLAILLFFAVPFGISISGCRKGTTVVYCNGGDSGVRVGQVTTITLQPKLYGISLSFAQRGQISSPAATDCKGTAESPTFRYGTTDMSIADVNPATGALCAGTWNRNSGGAIADFTTCNATNKTGVAFVTASADSTTSNPIPVYIHPVVTSVVLGPPSTNCTTDPATNCSPAFSTSSTTASPYTGTACLSQGGTGQLAARVYQNGMTDLANNISLSVGHLSYTPQTSAIVTIDENGVATAVAPGSTIISATISNASSSAGFFSVCPPVSITLTNPGVSVVNQNNLQPFTVVAKDVNGVSLTGLSLEYESTTPTTIPAGNASTTPIFPGAASIYALCNPPTCNPSPFNQIGLFGNGKPVSSNTLPITSPGTSGTILYIGSTLSQYIVPVDFTTSTLGTPVRLPYIPNSMVITQDGSTIYLGNSTELMVYNAVSNGLSRESTATPGVVLAVSPDANTIVISDPVRQVISLVSSAGGVLTTYGGVGTRAQWAPDSQTVYIAAGNQVLVYSTFTGWYNIPQLTVPVTDVSVAVPSVGAFFAGTTTTARGYCAATTVTTNNGQAQTTNTFYPDAGVTGPSTDRIAATNDGLHVLGATATPAPTFTDLSIVGSGKTPGVPVGACPSGTSPTTGLQFTTTPVLTSVLAGITASSITGVVPTSDSTIAFVTYTGTSGLLPSYRPMVAPSGAAATGAGTLSSVKLSGTATAPVAGVFSTDNLTFYTGTSGDNLIHLINRTTMTDASTIAPKLTDANGAIVVPNLLVQRPRRTTS